MTTVYRDPEFEKMICENAQESWVKYIDNLEEPDVDTLSKEAEENLIRSITPDDELSDEMIEIPDSLLSRLESIEKINESIKYKSAEIKQLEEQVRALQLPIEEQMAGNKRGYMITGHDYDYEFKFEPSAGRSSFDQKSLKADLPYIWEKYRKAAEPGNRIFKFFRTKKRS